jgi:predicted acyl esterase
LPIDDEHHKERSANWAKITVPFLSATNWGGQGLHPRGNFEGFTRAASSQKWLEVHGIEHWTHFYTDYGRALQKRFFDYFLKGENNGWDRQPRVLLQVRHMDRFAERAEHEWPLARTQWTKFYFDLTTDALLLAPTPQKTQRSFQANGDGLTFLTRPLDADSEITGPLAVKLFVSSSTEDADIFAVLRVFTPDLREVVFQGAIDPHTPVGQGWLRASHRKLNPALSKPWCPYHSHDERQPLRSGEIVELDIKIWPTNIVVPAAHRIELTIRGKDYEYVIGGGKQSIFKNELRGCGPFLHDDPRNRPVEVFNGETALHAKENSQPYLLLPIIPKK